MPDSSRLDTSAPSQTGYAPVSWMAVSSLVVAGFFALLLLVMAVDAYRVKQPLITPAVLILPALSVVLAFTARRQIQNSEGTRTGLQLASAGWWVSVMIGFVYVAYLFGTEYAIRVQAENEFRAWAETVKQIDPANPRDPKLYEAVLKTVPARSRSQVKGPEDTQTADKVFREELTRLRQLDVVRVAGRNRGNVEFTAFGVKDWQQTPGRIQCTLSCKMVTPEGEHGLVVPMQAEVDKAARQWQVVAAGDGFTQSKTLTRYGWLVEQLENSGKQFSGQFLVTADAPGQQPLAYQLFVRDADAAKGLGGATVAGLTAILASDELGYERALAGPLFSQPNGGPLSADERLRFRQCWEQGRIHRPGATLRDTPDISPVLQLAENAVELRVPVEINLSGAHGTAANAARGKLILRAVDPALVAELKAARDAKGAVTPQPPAELLSKPVPWRVVRIESDLKAVPVAAPPAGGPGGPGEGGPGGMFGG